MTKLGRLRRVINRTEPGCTIFGESVTHCLKRMKATMNFRSLVVMKIKKRRKLNLIQFHARSNPRRIKPITCTV